MDYYQWASLLQSLSGFESYRKIYSDVISPRRVAELLADSLVDRTVDVADARRAGAGRR